MGEAAGRVTPHPSRRVTRLIRLREVQHRVGLGRSTIYRWMAEGRFPPFSSAAMRLLGRKTPSRPGSRLGWRKATTARQGRRSSMMHRTCVDTRMSLRPVAARWGQGGSGHALAGWSAKWRGRSLYRALADPSSRAAPVIRMRSSYRPRP